DRLLAPLAPEAPEAVASPVGQQYAVERVRSHRGAGRRVGGLDDEGGLFAEQSRVGGAGCVARVFGGDADARAPGGGLGGVGGARAPRVRATLLSVARVQAGARAPEDGEPEQSRPPHVTSIRQVPNSSCRASRTWMRSRSRAASS